MDIRTPDEIKQLNHKPSDLSYEWNWQDMMTQTYMKAVSPRTYDIYEREVHYRNMNALFWFAVGATLVSIGAGMYALIFRYMLSFFWSVGLVAYFFAVYLLIKKKDNWVQKRSTFVFYLAEFVVYVWVLTMNMAIPGDGWRILFLIILLILPQYIIDKLWRVFVFELIWVLIFIGIIFNTIPRNEGLKWTAITLLAFAGSYMVSSFVMGERFENIVNYVNSKLENLDNRDISKEIIQSLTTAIDAKDPYTKGHSKRTALYAVRIAERAGFSEKRQQEVYYMGLLHDIGKIGVPDEVLNKTGRLTPHEYDLIKEHPVIGGDILRHIVSWPELEKGARYHHERYDGKGYPEGLDEDDIPEEARIIAVADAFDAMISVRRYRDAYPIDEVCEELERCKGTQFDPQYVNIMLDLVDEGKVQDILEIAE